MNDENIDTFDIHGLYHVHPRDHKFGEDNLVTKLTGSVPNSIQQGLLRSIQRNYPPILGDNVSNIRQDLIARLFSWPEEVASQSLAIVKNDKRCSNIVFLHAFNDAKMLISQMEHFPKESNKWKQKTNSYVWLPVSLLVITNVPAEVYFSGPFTVYSLANSPSEIVKQTSV